MNNQPRGDQPGNLRGVARLVDANANRAREALRTLEDVARFRLGDGELCGRIKSIRHDLRAALGGMDADSLLYAHRDTPGDVGTGAKATDEGERRGLRDVAVSAGKRAGEALRVLEECAKAASLDWAALERLRYRLYEAEKRLVLSMGTGRAAQWRLCVLVTESLCRRPWREVVREAVRGGADCIQVREPSMPDGGLLARAREVKEIAGVAVVVNNRVDVALAAGADGVHLGVDDLPIIEARKVCGDALLIGASTHDLTEARLAAEAGADYCGVGAMFVTATKVRPPSGPDYLRAYLADECLAAIPHLAIGGVTPENVGGLRDAGCRGVAASSVVCGSADPRGVCERLVAGLHRP